LFTLEEIGSIRRTEADLAGGPSAERFRARKQIEKHVRQWGEKVEKCRDFPLAEFDMIQVLSLQLDTDQMRPFYLRFLKRNLKNPSFELNDTIIKQFPPESALHRGMMAIKRWYAGEHTEAIDTISELLANDPTSISFNDILATWLMKDGLLIKARTHLKSLIEIDPTNVRHWDKWSLVNYQLYQSLITTNPNKAQKRLRVSFEASLHGLSLDPTAHSRFTMRVIRILFDLTQDDHILIGIFSNTLPLIPPQVWASMLPQIIARLGCPHDLFASNILLSVGETAPHAVLYSLLPACHTDDENKRSCARAILDRLRQHYPGLVDGTLQFAEQVLDVAATCWERWQAAIDAASRAFIKQRIVDRTIELLFPLHEAMERPPKSFYDLAFLGQYGAILANGRKMLDSFKATKNEMCFNKAWDFYAQVFRTNKIFLPSFKELDLADASPYLAELQNSPLAVPGTFQYGSEIVTVQRIMRQVPIMASKQRPKKMAIVGSNGIIYQFLLKTNEDTRLDERAMQIFDFISRSIASADVPFHSYLQITTYKVVPLTAKSGLIGWVRDCETVANLIVAYRTVKQMPVQAEKAAARVGKETFANLHFAKLAAFENGLKAHPRNDDLQKILVMLSCDSSDWLQRRLNYTTSLASTSMAGYILGLGDRHLQNIMMNTRTSKLAHIDFGDCFEIAMQRESYPEKVPFRLTRMLVGALEVTGTDGIFRNACENVLAIIRRKEEQILGLARALIDDPFVKDGKEKRNGQVIWKRIQDKLTGKDFREEDGEDTQKTPEEQVSRLIEQATSKDNLCEMFIGWVPFW
jgi:FKBP12-rapamycin complex-associated protein